MIGGSGPAEMKESENPLMWDTTKQVLQLRVQSIFDTLYTLIDVCEA